jgi:transketolase C-terminal domain/subunit
MELLDCKDFKDTRSGFGQGLLEIGRENPDVFALCADLTGSLKMDAFVKEFPERFVQIGIAEANMIGISAGLALSGKIPFAGSFAGFATGRVYDQIRMVVAYSNLNVKIAASHAGITLGEDGATILIWSYTLPVAKPAKLPAKGIFPLNAKPAEIPIILASAIPI